MHWILGVIIGLLLIPVLGDIFDWISEHSRGVLFICVITAVLGFSCYQFGWQLTFETIFVLASAVGLGIWLNDLVARAMRWVHKKKIEP